MQRRIAVKRLTASDLTFFEWHFRNRNAGNQKAINLNADVFVTEFYPALPELSADRGGKLAVDLSIYGPGLRGLHNLQRKIVKFGSYKNWRLNGEFVYDPPEEADRYHVMEPGDFAMIEFKGIPIPDSLKLILVCRNVAEDAVLHGILEAMLGGRSMAAVTAAQLDKVVSDSRPNEQHPVLQLIVDADLEDASLGGSRGSRRLFSRASLRQISLDDLLRARRSAEDTGRLGEELVNAHLHQLMHSGVYTNVEWTSQTNAVAPFDFRVVTRSGDAVLIDVKSTQGEFDRVLHVSRNELAQIAEGAERYDIYRVYDASLSQARLRVAENLRAFARTVLEALADLPGGVVAESISVEPGRLQFLPEVPITLPEDDERQT